MDDWQQKVYVCESIDGGVSIIKPAIDFNGSEDEWIKLNELDLMESYLTLYPIQLPGDRYFREAWIIGDDNIEICVNKARKIHIQKLRVLRNKKLASLDIAAIRAYEEGSVDNLNRVIELKQQLRDMPTDPIFDVDDVSMLRNTIPDYLR